MLKATRGDRVILYLGLSVILCLSYLLFIHDLGSTALWDPDEPRQAIEAREMMGRSDYVHPYLNGQPYLEKPPLYPWLIIIASKIQGGLDEFSARIPSALAATILLILTFFVGRRMAGPTSGLLAALALATNFLFLSYARQSVMDMTFALFIGLTICLGDLAVQSNRRWFFACALLPSVFAVLSNGPAGLLIPVGVLFLSLLCQRSLKPFFLPLVVGCLVALGLSSIWFIVAGEAYAREFILHQNLTRYIKGFDHTESSFYYFPKLFFTFLPWSCLLPFAIYHAVKRRLWLPLVWFAFTFLFFEFSRSKRAVYLLPLFPAMALLTGIFLKEKWETVVGNQWSGPALKGFALVIALCPILGMVAASAASNSLAGGLSTGSLGRLALTVLVFLGIIFFFCLTVKSPRGSLSAVLVYLICLGFFYHYLYLPAKGRDSKSVQGMIDAATSDSVYLQRVYACDFSSPAFIYYLKQPVYAASKPDDIPKDETGKTVVVKDQYGLPAHFSSRFSPVHQVDYDKDRFVVFVGR
ncbi:MAG TPA: hypothetical protein DCR97_10425 [Deltaproteobacteria bacterium]|nr:hypothetical protein [Deltaproteobacteria bacterium]